MGCLPLMVLAKSQHKGDGFTPPPTNVNLPSFHIPSLSHYLNGNWRGSAKVDGGKAVSIQRRSFPLFLFHLAFSPLLTGFRIQHSENTGFLIWEKTKKLKIDLETCFLSCCGNFWKSLLLSSFFGVGGKGQVEINFTLFQFCPLSIFSDCIRLLGPIW